MRSCRSPASALCACPPCAEQSPLSLRWFWGPCITMVSSEPQCGFSSPLGTSGSLWPQGLCISWPSSQNSFLCYPLPSYFFFSSPFIYLFFTFCFVLESSQLETSLVTQIVKNSPANEGGVCWEDPLGKGKLTHSSIPAWRIPWTEEPSGLQPIGHKESDVTERLTLPLAN